MQLLAVLEQACLSLRSLSAPAFPGYCVQVAAPTTMKLTFAVLALLCLSSAVSASSNAADFKLPLAGLLNGNFSHGLAEANLTIPGDCKQAA